MRLGKDLINKPIYTLDEGKLLGKVQEMCIRDSDGAEGVEDDEATHEHGHDAEQAEDGLGHVHVGQQLGVGRQPAQLKRSAQLGQDGLFDGYAPLFVYRVEVGFDRIDAAGHSQHRLGLAQGDQDLFVAQLLSLIHI